MHEPEQSYVNQSFENENNGDIEDNEYWRSQFQTSHPTMDHLTSTISTLSSQINFLQRKRSNSIQNLPSYLNFLSMFYLKASETPKQLPYLENTKENYQYLLSCLNNYIFEDSTKNVPNFEKKKIGISAEDIYSITKYKINLKQIPKYGKISFNQLYMEDIMSTGNVRGWDGKILSRNKLWSYSCKDRHNKEALKLIEQRRWKYKTLPRREKEGMDNRRLSKYWVEIAKHEIPKFPKIYQKSKNEVEGFTKRWATLVQKEVKKKVNKVQRVQKEYNIRGKKLQKEMMVFWRKREKEMVDIQKKKEKEEIDKRKKEDELQDQLRQKKRMEYLWKQSDFYSMKMYKHLSAYMPKDENEQNKETPDEQKNINTITNPNYRNEVIAGKEVLVNAKTNKIIFNSIKVDIDEKKAEEEAQFIIDKQKQKAKDFDQNKHRIQRACGEDYQTNPVNNINAHMKQHASLQNAYSNKMDIDNEPLGLNTPANDNQWERLDKPMITNTSSELLEAPKNFTGELKEYQLKGWRWWDNLYEQGINGILADEMGLGKTIQAISFLAHWSEDKNNWGPFWVIAPTSTLYNWQQEFNRFCPDWKVLSYWGPWKDRKTLRKFFKSSQLYVRNSAFHICITSYQLILSDEKVFHKVNWNYMILDEAQAIKNIESQRWNKLLSFSSRNRLLLTGTPIQNSMSELWALLHFIMPDLFDSHEQFKEWFSKDIEAHSQNKGEWNWEQLKRLHKILKPFMWRRVKKDVEHEIGPKIEHEIPCDMTEKQRIWYNSIKEKLTNISDLFMSTDSKIKVLNLMNLVMQFRKVCNHPEWFERNFGRFPFLCRDLVKELGCNSVVTLLNGDKYLRTKGESPISFKVPKMINDWLYKRYDIMRVIPKKWNMFSEDNIMSSLNISNNKSFGQSASMISFIGLLGFGVTSFASSVRNDAMITHLSLIHFFRKIGNLRLYYKTQGFTQKQTCLFINQELFPYTDNTWYHAKEIKNTILPPLIINSILSRKSTIPLKFTKKKFYIPKALAYPPNFVCSNRQYIVEQSNISNSNALNKLLYGSDFLQFTNSMNWKISNVVRDIHFSNIIPEQGLLTPLFYSDGGFTQIELPSFERWISDCGKLKKWDELLQVMSKEGHRVLIFCQMTHMINILEEYMAKRKYTYFRMDGSTNISDRRDMINEYQRNPKIFAFLLSTRACGLGVNLTGADTVIFYDNDWNPTMDAQATDRAHRIGQTKVVSVYRLITAGTIEERILKRAKQKQSVQTTVYSGGAFKADIFKQNDIVELLYSEEEMKAMEKDKKKLLLDTGNNSNINIVEGNNLVDNDNKEDTKNKKGKGKGKKEGKISKKKGNKNEQFNTASTSVNPVKKTLFSVKTSNELAGRNIKMPKFNTIKLDSDDDENNIIIDDGTTPIKLDDNNENEINELGFEDNENEEDNNMDIDS